MSARRPEAPPAATLAPGQTGSEPPSPVTRRTRVHGKETRLDRLLDFVALVAKSMSLSVLLDEVPARIAAILEADVVSLYLLEKEGGALVMRGNVGFPQRARGQVRLAAGEGLTGMAVELRRPVSSLTAPSHERFRGFPELHEERFPVFLAVPILGHQKTLGALVVQRAGKPFRPSDVRLAVSLTAPIAASIRHAHVLDDLRAQGLSRQAGGGTRKVTLPGTPLVAGRALGAVAALRRPAQSPRGEWQPTDHRILRTAFEVAEKALMAVLGRAEALGLREDAAFLSSYLVMTSDERMRQRAYDLVRDGKGIAQALSTVARDVARAANDGIIGDPFLQERARDLEDLCDALCMLASPDARAVVPSKSVLLGERLTVFDLLVSARTQPVGVALVEGLPNPRTRVLAQLMNVPTIYDVAGAFRWASPGDVALLDADHGFLIINPSRTEVASLRAERRKDT